MAPNLTDANSFLLRDYTAFVKQMTGLLPGITDRWTDYSVSEPDTIFLNNTAYLNDLISYAIDYRFLQASVKYTSDWDFLASAAILTGSSVPFYRETCWIDTVSGAGQELKVIKAGTVLYPPGSQYAVTVIRDAVLLPSSANRIPVIIGNAYSQALKKARKDRIPSADPIDLSSLFDIEESDRLARVFSSAQAVFDYFARGRRSYFVSRGTDSALLMSPSMEYADYDFVQFTLEDENVLASGISIDVPGLSGYATLVRETEGTKQAGIGSHKAEYLDSLDRIETDISPSLFADRLSRAVPRRPGGLPTSAFAKPRKSALRFRNNRDAMISKSFVSYQEGYIDISGYIPAGTHIDISYDWLPLPDDPQDYRPGQLSFDTDGSNESDMTINLLLDEGKSVKANSLVMRLRLPEGFGKDIYMTDYDSRLILPRGYDCGKDYLYLLEGGRECTSLAFAPGRAITADGQASLFIGSQTDRTLHIQGRPYGLQRGFCVLPLEGYRAGDSLDIQDGEGRPLYLADGGSGFLAPDPRRSDYSDSLPSLVFHDSEGVRVLPAPGIYSLLGDSVSLQFTLDGSCSYSRPLSSSYLDPEYADYGLYLYPYPSELGIGTDRPTPERVCVTAGQGMYCSDLESDSSEGSWYNSVTDPSFGGCSIDLYGLESSFVSAKEVPIDVTATVYTKPLDSSDISLDSAVRESLADTFGRLEIGQDVLIARILSAVVHSSEYVSYAELSLPKRDQFMREGEIAVLGEVILEIKNPAIMQF